MILRLLIVLSALLSYAAAQTAADTAAGGTAQQQLPTVSESVEVTTTRLPEDPEKVPMAIEVFDHDMLSALGATDLRSALSLATGVEIAPGGDTGPASSVPDFWGLKEFDAFLLVVDGVPRGGAFNPALTTLSFSDVSRIEVLRGPAPVTYGATSFVGVIQVVHNDATFEGRELELRGGSFGTGGGAFSTQIPLPGNWASRLTAEGERVGFSDDRTDYRRGNGLWRASHKSAEGNRLWFAADWNWLDQDPASPRPREDTTLSPNVLVDTNQNMAGAFVNDHRGTLMGGFDHRAFGDGVWSTTVSVSPDRQDIFRGFLDDFPACLADNLPTCGAHGFREKISLTDVYADSHLSWSPHRLVKLLLGTDYLYGRGRARGADFDYDAPLSGSPAPVVAAPADLDFHIDDDRGFFGAYGGAEWTPIRRLRIDAGIRLNVTHEEQTVIHGGAGPIDNDSRTDVRPGGSVGAIVTAWQSSQDSVRLFVNYRDTFKPAAIDFGIGEDEGGAGGELILKPETARSVEGGLKGRFLRRRLELEASGFLMNFENLVVATDVGGVPGLTNSGSQRFQGFEAEGTYLFPKNLMVRASYSFHDAHFTDFVQDFNDGNGPTQLAGKRIEMSARNLASAGVLYSPAHGLFGGVVVNYTGSRFLDKRNTALAPGFADVGITAGYRTRRWELRVDAHNLADRREPVSESELGDAQYYLLPARRAVATFKWHL